MIPCGFSINQLKNIFNIILPQFLKDDKEYNQKIACKRFRNEYKWLTDWLITKICIYVQLWINCPGSFK